MTNTIFIQIAAYRDPELPHTLNDCIMNADFPDNLKFCICWQKDENENLDIYLKDSRFIILPIHYAESKGCCWARNKIQQFYNGEKYTLQLDSHHRFIKGWDTQLINMITLLQERGHKKPLITAYAPSYDPANDPHERVLTPWQINFDRITEDGQILTRPGNIKEDLQYPVPAKFYSAHFAFTIGEFCIHVQHDPQLYFIGEEMNIGIRAFTHGYTLFHPNIVILWHEYTRKNRRKHWDDDSEWWKKDLSSKTHYLNLFKAPYDSNNKYGIGNERTIQEYIEYTKIDLLYILNQQENKKNINPSNNQTVYKVMDDSWNKWIYDNLHIGVNKETIKDILLTANFDPHEIKLILNL